MKPSLRSVSVVTTVATLSLQVFSVQAYETDVHYGLTYWLARQQGLDGQEAHEMARGDQNADDGYLDAVHAVVWSYCIRGDKTASEMVRRHHFRSQHPVPADPKDRPVSSSFPYAATDVQARINDVGTEWLDNLNEFGLALHGWQDSFSHQGESSAPSLCNSQWVWAHGRGANERPWLSHNADLTYLYFNDCRDAARTSYAYIGQLVKKHNPQAKVGPEWPALDGDVAKFCAAETKTAKFDWLKEHDVPQAEAIVKKIDLVDGARDFGNAPELNLDGKTSSTEAKREVDRVVEGAYAQLGQMQNEAVDRMFESFLRDWVSKPPVEMTSVAKNYFAFGARGFASTGEVEDRLLRARLRDRGLARDPNLNLPKLMKEPKGWIGDLNSAFVFPRDRKKPFLVGRAGDGGKDTSIVLATFRNAPHDVHIFSTQQQGDSVRITGWQTLAFP